MPGQAGYPAAYGVGEVDDVGDLEGNEIEAEVLVENIVEGQRREKAGRQKTGRKKENNKKESNLIDQTKTAFRRQK